MIHWLNPLWHWRRRKALARLLPTRPSVALLERARREREAQRAHVDTYVPDRRDGRAA